MNARWPLIVCIVIALALSAPLMSCNGGGGGGGGGGPKPPTDGDMDTDEIIADGDPEPDADLPDGDPEADPEWLPGDLTLSPGAIEFGLVALNGEKTLSFTMENGADLGGETITILSVELLKDQFSDLSISENCLSTDVEDLDLAPGEDRECSITCAPVSPFDNNGVLRVVAVEVGEAWPHEARVNVTCHSPSEILHIDPVSISFGYIGEVGVPHRFVSIGNLGSAPLVISEIALIEGSHPSISIAVPETRSNTLAPNEGLVVEINFVTPREAGYYRGWLSISLDDPDEAARIVPISARTVDACPYGSTLVDDVCVKGCAPLARRCDEGQVMACNAEGDLESAVETCADGMQCYRGHCLWSRCMPDTIGCLDGWKAECTEEGGAFEEPEPCDDEDLCTANICLIGGGCDYAANACDDSNDCTDDSCDPGTGCDYVFNTQDCEDGSLCTEDDHCQSGRCVGEQVNCPTPGQCYAALCDPLTGCGAETTEGPCEDNDVCTENDHCDEGDCVGDAVICPPDDNICTDSVCLNPDGCKIVFNTEGCDDGNLCTEEDVCDQGLCKGDPIDPDDGLYCNGVETCDPDIGVLHPNPVICNDGFACTADSCNEESDGCDFIPDNGLCDDANPCTDPDLCEVGAGCVNEALPDMEPCDVLAGVEEICLGGQCVRVCLTDLDCQDGFGCTYDHCDQSTGFCRNEPVHEQCRNDLFCDGEERCDPIRGCVPGNLPNLEDEFNCTLDTCDEESDTILHEPRDEFCNDFNTCTRDVCLLAEGCVHIALTGFCDDDDPCTVGDKCLEGECAPGNEDYDCDDKNPCTDHECSPGYGCIYFNNDDPCDLGDPCGGESSCLDGVCVGNGCDDGVFCNGLEICAEYEGAPVCIPGDAVDCDDGVDCTIDNCDEEELDCLHEPDDSLCESDNACVVTSTCTVNGCQYEMAADGTPCQVEETEGRECHSGFCVSPCLEDIDCNDDWDCTDDTCNTEIGFCVHTPVHVRCTDNLYCTGEEVCDLIQGCLPGEAVDCDDGVPCTVDSCDNDNLSCNNDPSNELCEDYNTCTDDICTISGCSHPFSDNPCNDRLPCTINDTCVDGLCVGIDNPCDDHQPCSSDYCLPSLGCQSDPIQDGLSCGSGFKPRYCDGGYCTSGCPDDESCDDGVSCTIDYCDPDTHICVNEAADELCDDGLFCNGTEICDPELNCLSGEAVDCDDGIDCTEDFCDDGLGECVYDVAANVCDDGNMCTTDLCNSTPPNPDCLICDTEACTGGAPDPRCIICDTEECLEPGCLYEFNELPCDDGNLCTVSDRCLEGVCEGDVADCDDGSECTEDFCHPLKGCYHVDISDTCRTENPCLVWSCSSEFGCLTNARNGPCDNGNACTVNDFCGDDGTCLEGVARSCDDNDPCTEDSCNEASGCLFEPVGNGGSCIGDLFFGMICMDGLCAPECVTDKDCNDFSECTADSCNTGLGVCEYARDHASCGDGKFCNGNEICEPFLGCVSGTPEDCNDGIDCTVDFCNQSSDVCVNDPADMHCDDGNVCTVNTCDAVLGCQTTALSGDACDDDDICTGPDTCQSGECTGSPISCFDDNPCTVTGSCHQVLGCLNSPVEDGQACGSNGTCLNGQCAESCTDNSECNDGIACTVDFCDVSIGRCRQLSDNEYCDDGAWCNGSEICKPMSGCEQGMAPVCDDNNDCTADSCDESSRRCSFDPIDILCDDGNECTTDSCSVEVGGCNNIPNELTSCDDGNICTENDMCYNGYCQGNIVFCGEESECVLPGCDPRIGCVAAPAAGGNCDHPCSPPWLPSSAICIGMECVSFFDCAEGNPCVIGICSEETGCQTEPVGNGAACETEGGGFGECLGGVCTSVCENEGECDDSNPCTDDACDETDGCTHSPKEDTSACTHSGGRSGQCENGVCLAADCVGNSDCDDLNPCTVDSCDAGDCLNTPDDDLCNDGNECTADTCDAIDGCSNGPISDAPCDYDDPCVVESGCMYGRCLPLTRKNCEVADPCIAGSCNATSGECVYDQLSGVLCNDGDPCTHDDICSDGLCAGTAYDCDDGNTCTEDICLQEGGCTHFPLTGSACDDVNACTEVSMCIDGACIGSDLVDCDDGNSCTTDYCDSEEGCKYGNITGRACEDGDPCTLGDTCLSGDCIAGSGALLCEDGDPCTADSCDSESGCLFTPMDDMSPCDAIPGIAEVCASGECIVYCESDAGCNDGVDCTNDTCDTQTHACTHTPDWLNCNDGNVCNGSESCDPQLGCKPGVALSCDDEVECTDDACITETGECVHLPQHYLCDDENACTLDTCVVEVGCENYPIEGCE